MSPRELLAAPPPEVLVVVTRRIGDVLLASPLIRSLRAAWPDTAVDALVFEGTRAAPAGNADVRRVWTVPERPSARQHLVLLGALFHRYALALSLVPGDRPTLYAAVAGRRRAGLLEATPKAAWKRRLLHAWVPFDDRDTHTVRMHLALARLLGVPERTEITVAWTEEDERAVYALLGVDVHRPLAVLHPYPRFRYKMWPSAHWIALGRALAGRGYRLALTGGPDPREMAYVAEIAAHLPRVATVDAAGRLTLPASACLVARAALYVGPDTAMTHVAAALGVPTVALYGPSNPVKWGPWPRGHAADSNPWERRGDQRAGNVVLLQGSRSCVPCLLEGCDRHTESESLCLTELPTAKVIEAVETFERERCV